MTDKECWDALKNMRAKAAGKKDGSEHKDRDIRALNHAICLLGERVIDRERMGKKWMDQEVENGRRAADDFVNKLDNASKPVKNKCMVCGRVIHDDKAICDKCYEIAKKEGLLI